MGYVERSAGGWTELRVHGVAGTPPEAVLQHPHAERLAGNPDAGFLRRLWEARSVSADTPHHRREVYSWGGLTSGDNLRALWLLLLPFMLLNVAFYTTPWRRPPEPDGWRPDRSERARRDRRRDRLSSAVQRVLALSLTLTFTLTAVTVAMDLVGWKCAAPSGAGGVCGTWWLGWLDVTGLRDRPGRQVAVTALAPLAVIGFLWWLAGATWDRLERVDPPASPASTTRSAAVRQWTPLEDRAMWNGRDAVRRLRAVHVATGLAVPGVFALAAVRPAATGWWPVLAALLGFLAAMAALVAHPAVASRARPSTATPGAGTDEDAQAAGEATRERHSPFRWLPWCALVLTAAALAVASAAGDVEPAPGPPGTPVPLRSTLPGLVGTLQATFAVQGALLVLLLVACWWLLWRARGERRLRGGGDAVVPAWRGHAMPAFALLAWVLAGGLSAGVVLRAAETLGTPVAPGWTGTDPYPLVVPLAYQWVAAAAFALAVVAVLSAVFVWWRLRWWKGTVARVAAVYGARAAREHARTEEIARAWARASAVTTVLRQVFGLLLTATAVVVAVGAVGFVVLRAAWTVDEWLVTAGNAVLSASVLGLLWVGRQAYRDPAQRRTVGIVWDLGTFWPRAVHPLAPPCYAERTIPDLIGRLQYLTGTGADGTGQKPGTVLLSCHSQGSVLGAVVLLQADLATSARTAFLTYGCPLSRLYSRFFPAYFSATALDRLGGFLSDAPDDPGRRSAWRWRNLHRPSDPIGGPVFVAREPTRTGTDLDDVDRPLLDPVFARAAGDRCRPPIRGHSDYFADPAFAWTTEVLRRTGWRDARSAGEPDGRAACGPG